MIRFDGYYIDNPVLFQEREELEPWYNVSAYQFLENGKVRVISKYIKDKEIIYFKKADFNVDYTEHCYSINNNEIYFIYKCEESGDKFYYDIITPTKIKYRDEGDIMKFVPWSSSNKEEKTSSLKGLKNSKKDRPIASPLDTLKNEAKPNTEILRWGVIIIGITIIRYILRTYF